MIKLSLIFLASLPFGSANAADAPEVAPMRGRCTVSATPEGGNQLRQRLQPRIDQARRALADAGSGTRMVTPDEFQRLQAELASAEDELKKLNELLARERKRLDHHLNLRDNNRSTLSLSPTDMGRCGSGHGYHQGERPDLGTLRNSVPSDNRTWLACHCVNNVGRERRSALSDASVNSDRAAALTNSYDPRVWRGGVSGLTPVDGSEFWANFRQYRIYRTPAGVPVAVPTNVPYPTDSMF